MACTIATMLLTTNAMTVRGQSASSQQEKSIQQAQPPRTKTSAEASGVHSIGYDKMNPAPSSSDRYENSFRNAPKHFLMDQKAMWTSPAKIRVPEATWLVPLGGFAAGLLVTDTDASRQLNNAPNTLRHYRQFSNYGVGAMAGAAGGLYFLGLATHNRHQREAGFLSGEAAVDSLVAVEALKYMTRRERPFTDNANGNFWHGGDSFPSEHAAAAWSIAGIIAHEYPGPLPKIAAYGLASAVSVSRITSKEHFPSDVLVGSALGWLVGYYVYRQHHDPELAGGPWELLEVRPERPSNWQAKFMGSPYVPLDSWVYPALLRLAALGYIKSDFEGMRPWTRMECARLVEEAGDHLSEGPSESKGADGLYESLAREFSNEISLLGGGDNRDVRLESLYSRTGYISGMPLTDGYNFAQTQINDFGRPYGEGFNSVTGFSSYGTWGPWVGYVRGELQTAPSIPALPLSARQFVAATRSIPSLPPATASSSAQQFQLLDAYAGITLSNWELSFGRQSLWWGPGDGGSLMFSDNAVPIDMFRINRVSPFELPSFLKFLGPVRTEIFIGQLEGQHFFDTSSGIVGSWTQAPNPQPLIDGWKVSFKPTPNFEFGLSYTTIFGGVGVPTTPRTFVQAILDTGGDLPDGTSKSSRENGLDFSYRIPKLRKWLTLYGDGFAHDQIIFFIAPKAKPLPFGYPDRAAWHAGIYVPMFPGLRKFDFRAEGVFTSNPAGPNGGYDNGFYYTEDRYLSGYTNRGLLLGSWIGRAGQGVQAWTNCWFTSKDRLQFSFRHQKVSQTFIPGGGTLTDGGVHADFWIRNRFSVAASVQYEKWNFPIIAATQQTNINTSIQLTFWPSFRRADTDTSTGTFSRNSVPTSR